MPERFRVQTNIVPAFNVGATIHNEDINAQNCTIHCMSGSVYINTQDTASADNSFKLTNGMLIDVFVQDNLSLISDSSATVQIFVWE